MIVDLHTHSAASDGQYAPAALAALAAKRGIEVLALTDHDTVDGTAEAIAAGERLGVRVLRGVEFSAGDYHKLHILGYCFRPEPIRAFLDRLRARRDARRYKIADFLRNQGVEVDLALVERHAGGGSIGRPHFARAMVEQGIVGSVGDAFSRFLDTPEFRAIDTGKPSAKDCIAAIHGAGGAASLAHPYQAELDGKESLEALVERLAGYGLDALECFYTRHTPEMTAAYLELAARHNLHVTGGSDFHGDGAGFKPDIPLARWELDAGWLPDFFAR